MLWGAFSAVGSGRQRRKVAPLADVWASPPALRIAILTVDFLSWSRHQIVTRDCVVAGSVTFCFGFVFVK